MANYTQSFEREDVMRNLQKSSIPDFSWRKKFLIKTISDKLKDLPKEHSAVIKAVAKLIINHFQVLVKEPIWMRELYLQLVAVGTKPELFEKYLTDIGNESPFWQELAVHNLKVKLCFERSGIDWSMWLKFNKAYQIDALEYEKVIDKEFHWQELLKNLAAFQKMFENTPLFGSVRKDCIEIQKKKQLIISGNFKLSDGKFFQLLFPKYCAALDYFKRKGIKVSLTFDGDVWDNAIERIARSLVGFYRDPKLRTFQVNLWKRQPFNDLLQGNASNCCIAIGKIGTYPAVKLPGVDYKKYPAGILNYITDLGIQVAEIWEDIDGGDMALAGQCWLYVALDESGRPMLVADSLDLRSEFRSEPVNSAIRDCMFEFLKDYAISCNIKKVLLGKSGPVLLEGKDKGEIHKITNRIGTGDLKVLKLPAPLEKLGSYFLNKVYFLETRGGNEVYLIMDNENIADRTLNGLRSVLNRLMAGVSC